MKLHMRVSRSGLELVKRFEGLRRTAARLPNGGWTIGYGHTLSAREGAEVGPADAEDLLLYDLNRVAEAVGALVFTPLNQNQFDALAAFVFNIGVENLRGSAVLKRLNEGCYLKAAAAMELWRKADLDGESLVVDALIRRRAAEKALFLTPPGGFRPTPTPVVRPTHDGSALDMAARSSTPLASPVVVDVSMEGAVATLALDAGAREPTMAPETGAETETERGSQLAMDFAPSAASTTTAKLHQLFPDPESPYEAFVADDFEPFPAAAVLTPAEGTAEDVDLEPSASQNLRAEGLGGISGLAIALKVEEPAPQAQTPEPVVAEAVAPVEPQLMVAPEQRFFEPPPRRFPAASPAMAFPAAANEAGSAPICGEDRPPAAAELSEASGLPEAIMTPPAALPPPPTAAAAAPRPSSVTANIPASAAKPKARPVSSDTPRPWLLQVSIGLLGVALFAGAIYSMFQGMATLLNLGIGLFGVACMVPAGVHLLLMLPTARADPEKD